MSDIKTQKDIDKMQHRKHFERTEQEIWFGPEIEYTRHFGKPTLCIRGIPTLTELNEALEQFPEINHMFFGGPYENEMGLFQDPNELDIILHYLACGFNVTVQARPREMYGNLLAFFLQQKDNEKLCIFVPCQIPMLQELGDRVDIKLDDPAGVDGPNGGVWVMSANNFKENGGETIWDSYNVDILIK